MNRGRTVALQAGLLATLGGLVLLALLLLRDGDVAAPSVEPAPPNALVWQSESSPDFRIVSEQPSSCGDAATADTYGVPMVLRILSDTALFTLGKTVLLGLEAMPYEYVPAQVTGQALFDPSPAGWEVSRRASLGFGPNQYSTGDYFLRRLDQPALLFRYSAGFCDQEDGSPLSGGRVFGSSTIRLPADLPEIIVHAEGDYLSAQEAMKIVTSRLPAGVRPVRATLDRRSAFINGSTTSDGVVWSIMLAAGDVLGPKRLGQEYGMTYAIDASTGRPTGQSCCFELVFSE